MRSNGKGACGHVQAKGLISVAIIGLAVGGCAGGADLKLGSLTPGNAQANSTGASNAPATSENDLDRAIAYWGKQHSENPKDYKAAMSYVKNLRAAGRDRQALSVLQQASFFHGRNRDFAGEYGRLALKFEQVSLAEKLLRAADDPSKPDWKILSALGTAVAKQGRYNAAIGYYERALRVKPDQPSLLNNLAMAYAASGKAAEAEPLLRKAALTSGSSQKVQKNLALVLSLQGKHTEAQQIGLGNLRGSASPATITSSNWITKFAQR